MSTDASASKGRKAKAKAAKPEPKATVRKDGVVAVSHGPAKGVRPPFEKGNAAGLTGGHRSPRVYGELATLLAAGLVEDRPDLAAYPEAVAAWATAEAQAALLRRHLDAVGLIDPTTNEPRQRLLDNIRATERSAARLRAPLGLDPTSEAKLMKERAAASVLAVDLNALAERGRQALAGREPEPDIAGQILANAHQANAELWADAKAKLQAEHGQTEETSP